VLGCTALWGGVVEHTDGWRGEFGYPLVLFVLPAAARRGPGGRPVRRGRVYSSALGDLGTRFLGTARTLAEDLARLYAVPVHLAPSVLDTRPVRSRVGGPADALRAEAADGLAGRRSGDPIAEVRLEYRVQDLLDAMRE
jgi:hypothetical protein